MKKLASTLLGALLVMATSLQAQIVPIQAITYSGTNPDAGIGGIINPTGLINGAGLSASLTPENITTVTHNNPFDQADNTWATNDANGGFGNDFFAAGGVQGTVVFELILAETATLDQFYVWSYDFDEPKPNANNFKTITVDYGIGDFLGGTLTDVEFTAPRNNLTSVAQLGGISADRLRITVTDNWFDGNNIYQGGDRVATAEFALVTAPAVPDPLLSAPEVVTVNNNGSLQTVDVVLTNDGAAQDLEISAVRVSGLDAGAFTVLTDLTTPLVIAPGGGTATIQIQVDPAGLIPGADIVDTFLEVDSNSTVDQPSVSIPIEGYLRDPWIDTVETVTLDPVLSSAGVQNFTVDVTNLGTSDLTVDDASFFGSESFTVLDDLFTNPLVLAAGETGQVNLSFDPTGLSGTVNAILDLFADDPITAGASIAYTVNVVRDPVIQYDTTLSFVFNGLEPQSIEIPIDNAGTVSSLEISGANFIIGGDEANFVLTGNLPTIPAGEFANLTFDFTPTAERYGTYSAVLEVASNDPVDAAAKILINVTMLPTSPAPFSPASVDDAAGNSFANAAYAATNLIGGDFVTTLGDAPAGSNNWVSDTSPADYFEAGVQPVLVFDLGADVDVRLLYLWAYSEGTTFTGDRQGNSLRSFSLRFATDADTTEGFGTTIAINPSFTMAPGLVTTEGVEFGTPQAQPVQAYDLGSTVKARYVEMTLADNYFGLPQHDGGDRVGFNEIAFDSLAQPPSGSPFETWMAEFTELSGDDLLPTADPDGDGSSNLTEFAFDGDPTDSNNNGKISLVIADGSDTPDLSDELILTMAMRAGAAFADSGSPLISDAIDGLIYQVEGSTDLADFTGVVNLQSEAIGADTLPIPSEGWEYRSFSLDGSNGLTGKGFLRAGVSGEAP